MRKTFTASLLLLSAFPLFSFANQGEEKPQADYVVKKMMDFESEEECASVMSMSTWGTKVLYNTDSQYVKQGNGSLHVSYEAGYTIPMPNYYPDFYQQNTLRWHLITSHYITHENDYSRLQSFVFDAYPVERNITVRLSIVTNSDEETFESQPVVLEQGRWNTAVFSFDPLTLSHFKVKTLSWIYLTFDTAYTGGKDIDVYLDHFRSREYPEDIEDTLALPHLGQDEIADFEDDYLPHTLRVKKNNTAPYNSPWQFRYHRKKDEQDPYVHSGRNSLEIIREPYTSQTSGILQSYDLLFPEEYVKQIDFSLYDPSKWDIVFDVYNAYRETLDCMVDFVDGKTGSYVSNYDETIKDPINNAYIKPYTWTEIRIPMDKMTYSKNGSLMAKSLRWNDVREIRFRLREYFGSQKASMFIDSLRFERRK